MVSLATCLSADLSVVALAKMEVSAKEDGRGCFYLYSPVLGGIFFAFSLLLCYFVPTC